MEALTRPSKVGRWSESALRVLRERYLIRREGEPAETPEEMCWRVALAIARAEESFGRSLAGVGEVAAAFYDMMVEGQFLPNSPTLMNAGKDNHLQYSACYVLPVGDSMPEIFDSVKAAAIILNQTDAIVAGVSIDGWDTHSDQVQAKDEAAGVGSHTGNHAGLLRRVGWSRTFGSRRNSGCVMSHVITAEIQSTGTKFLRSPPSSCSLPNQSLWAITSQGTAWAIE
jgi:ribonucleotide reductase alpha subunit